MLRSIIVNIDDYAASIEADERIRTLLGMGAANSVSCFATSPLLENSLTQLIDTRDHCPYKFDIGVHLDLTFGKVFSTVSKNNSESLKQKIPISQIEDEFEKQIAKIKSFVAITHMDNHRHEIYLQPEYFEIVVKLAHRHNLWLRTPFTKAFEKKMDAYSQAYSVDRDILQSIYERSYSMQTKLQVKHSDDLVILTKQNRSIDGLYSAIADNDCAVIEICTHAGQARKDFSIEFELFQQLHSKRIFKKARAQLRSRQSI